MHKSIALYRLFECVSRGLRVTTFSYYNNDNSLKSQDSLFRGFVNTSPC